ncbi:MAG TPA: phosphate ABC transporter ATP-binding protein [Candidatus Gallimonas gallistercoris]|uniref:Phosphate ABC transporter ATP-binding protein n=1 Tax=Candidatus Gallimonas gallistercoris TaxID=2838602 RepID=A0A9D2KGR6_9FIRM|nr:phosphate ABC transporter ATP-binding protein [Candidatus Gallimonas gallistercoris]
MIFKSKKIQENKPAEESAEPVRAEKQRGLSQFAMGDVAVSVHKMDLFYGSFQALKNINMEFPQKKLTALIGPSGCGKSTLLKSLNRMNDLVDGCKITGEIKVGDTDIYQRGVDLARLRKNVGMVFQRPNPLAMSVYDNIAYGPRTFGIKKRADLDAIVEKSLRGAAMWDEVKDRLNKSALGLSGGQQQRLCIARALAVEPQVLLMDEPTSALDPISTGKIEELCKELKNEITVIMVTHNMQQAFRIADYTAYFLLGEMVEMGDTQKIFTNPDDKRTEDYVNGRFG